MEIIDLHDKFRNKTMKTQPRKQPLEDQAFRNVLHICLFDNKGRMLLQLLKSGNFVPYKESIIKLIYEMRKSTGVFV